MFIIDKTLQKENLKWQNPLNFAKKIADNYGDESWIFLYSGLNKEIDNSYSYIALFPKKELITNDYFEVEKIIKNETWFGYFSYEVLHQFEEVKKTKKSYIDLPKIWLFNFSLILQFCHKRKEIIAFFDDKERLLEVLKYKKKSNILENISAKNLKSNFSNQSYLAEISKIKKMIANGDFYQANLTRKFFGKLNIKNRHPASYFTLFSKLCKLSPANYSSFLSFKGNYIISASPELFLAIDEKLVKSKPIKGTAAKLKNKELDLQNKLALENNIKEKAENLMIVDLVRNDLSRVCEVGTVKVSKLFEITSYKTLHHMSSEIIGNISKNIKTSDVIKACFPAGSMTGAPKIKAMEIISQNEKINRGVYSGAIGFLSKEMTNLSVVIRTLICKSDKFEFQVGGAITFDSDEKKELEEIFCKGKAIMKLLKPKL